MIYMMITQEKVKKVKTLQTKPKRRSPSTRKKGNDLYGIPKERFKQSGSYFEVDHIFKGIILLGVILLITFLIFFISSSTVPSESIWEDSFTGSSSPFLWVLPMSLVLILIGGILYFFHLQFSKLARFAEEVESGEFEKKVLKELEDGGK
ncbi:hypothetical protein [[Eubacterium] cellulosolvens]